MDNIQFINPFLPEEPHNKIEIAGDITEEKGTMAVAAIMAMVLHDEEQLSARQDAIKEEEQLAKEEGREPEEVPAYVPSMATILVSSNGGFLEEMLAICDAIAWLKKTRTVQIIAIGKIASAAVPIVASGTPGFRRTTPNTRFGLHDPQIGIQGSIRDTIEELKIEKKYADRYFSILESTTNIKKAGILKKIHRKSMVWYDAEQAKEFGIIDHIS